MYICICNSLKESDLKKFCTIPCENGEGILNKAGCKSQCGQCIDYIETFLLPNEQTLEAN